LKKLAGKGYAYTDIVLGFCRLATYW